MKYIQRNLIVGAVALLLNGIWEYAVCAYYYDIAFIRNMTQLMAEATVGDVAVTMLFFNIVLMMRRDSGWVFKVYDYFNLSAYGFGAAMYFEARALSISRWSYSEAMPTLSPTGIGLLPIFQFMLLIPLAVWAEPLIASKWKRSGK